MSNPQKLPNTPKTKKKHSLRRILLRVFSPFISKDELDVAYALLNNPMKTRRVIGRMLYVDPAEVRQTENFKKHLKFVRKLREQSEREALAKRD